MSLAVADRMQTRIVEIQETVAAFYGVAVDDVVNGGRRSSHVEPRRIAMALCRQAGASYQLLCLAFHKDRATIIHAIERARGCVPPELRHLGRPVVDDAPAPLDEADLALQSGQPEWAGVERVAEPPVRTEPGAELRLARIEQKLDRLMAALDHIGLRGVA